MPPLTTKPADDPSTAVAVRRILCSGFSAGYIDAVGFLEPGGIYIAAMTGNSVQLGISLAERAWPHVAMVVLTIGSFFIGGLLSSYFRRRQLIPGARSADRTLAPEGQQISHRRQWHEKYASEQQRVLFKDLWYHTGPAGGSRRSRQMPEALPATSQ